MKFAMFFVAALAACVVVDALPLQDACAAAACKSQCECGTTKCDIAACLKDATCAKVFACAVPKCKCGSGNLACVGGCVKAAGPPSAVGNATLACFMKNCPQSSSPTLKAEELAATMPTANTCSADDVKKYSTNAFSCGAVKCAKASFFGVDKTAKCIATDESISTGCAMCFGQVAQCALKNCAVKCMSDPTAPACQACGHEHCDAAEKACTGHSAVPPDPKNCPKTEELAVTGACDAAACKSQCECGTTKCDIAACMKDATCAKVFACAVPKCKCGSGNLACVEGCVKAAGPPSAVGNATLACFMKNCPQSSSITVGVNQFVAKSSNPFLKAQGGCDNAACKSKCECAATKCDLPTCLGDPDCASLFKCAAPKCLCGAGNLPCVKKCVSASPSAVTKATLKCFESNC